MLAVWDAPFWITAFIISLGFACVRHKSNIEAFLGNISNLLHVTSLPSLGIVLGHTGPSESSLLVSRAVLNLFVGRTCLGKFRVGPIIFVGGLCKIVGLYTLSCK